MINQIAYTTILGFPAIMWGGILTLLCFTITAAIGMLGAAKISHKYHVWMARISLLLGFLHGIMGLSMLLKF